MTETLGNDEKMTFKDYYNSLNRSDKKKVRDQMVPRYISSPSFYQKVGPGYFTELELEKLENITGQTFAR